MILKLPLGSFFSSCVQRRGGRWLHGQAVQLKDGGLLRLQDLLSAQDDDSVRAVHPSLAEQHRL